MKRKSRKILSKSLIPYFLNTLNKDEEILVKRSPELLNCFFSNFHSFKAEIAEKIISIYDKVKN